MQPAHLCSGSDPTDTALGEGEDHDDDTDDEGERDGETDETQEPQTEDDPEFQRHAPDIDFDPETASPTATSSTAPGTPSRRCTPLGTSATTCASHCTRNTPCSPATM